MNTSRDPSQPCLASLINSETQRPLARATEKLVPNAARIRRSWRRSLTTLPVSSKDARNLYHLDPTPVILQRGIRRFEFYERRWKGLQKQRQRLGIHDECASAAFNLYVESCLPYLLAERGQDFGSIVAFVRLAWVGHCLLAREDVRERDLNGDSHQSNGRWERRLRGFSAHIGEIYERERRRLARDLHDEIGHDLVVLRLYLEMIALDLRKAAPGKLRRKLQEAITLVKHALAGVRRLTFDLGPSVWSQQGFVPAIRVYAQQFARRTQIKVRVDARRFRRKLPASCETALYKVLQGALSNVAGHAKATKAVVSLSSGGGSVTMKIQDDGKGFDVGKKLRSRGNQAFGLRAMQERVELLGGNIRFASQPSGPRSSGGGTSIEVVLPLRSA